MPDIASLLSRLPGAGGAPGGPTLPGPPGPGMGAARPNIGPVTTPQPHAGNAAAAMNDVRNAVTMLEKALPGVPMGTPLHTALLKATTDIAKHLAPGENNPGLELQSLLNIARQASQSQPLAALSRLQPGPNAPPAMPAPGGAEGGNPTLPMAA